MQFLTPAKNYPYRSGSLFLGLTDGGQEVGISTERHALTVAGARAGKGACLLIPNARRWPENLLVVDPKGEVAAASWEAREALGQTVAVLDPFKVADIPERLRASFNPLASISTDSPTGREDLEVLADGLVKRSDPKHEEWYDGASSMLAGLLAYVVEFAPPDHRNLAGLRALLLQPNESLYTDAQGMLDASAFGGLARETGVALMTAIEAEKGMEKDFLAAARRYTKWMDSPPIAAALASSSFDLAALKSGNLSLFLVLPAQYIDTHAAFLRLFVRSAINAMMQDGAKVRRRCLFLLDEFYSLGRMDIVAKAAGLMSGYGLQIWPFLQDLGQLQSLYRDNAEQTFFGNSDAVVFFGNTDPLTLEHISHRLGVVGAAEVGKAPAHVPQGPNSGAIFGAAMSTNKNRHLQSSAALVGGALSLIDGAGQAIAQKAAAKEMAEFQAKAMTLGKQRLPPEQVAAMVGKRDGDTVARAALVFAKAGDVLQVTLSPYFQTKKRKNPSRNYGEAALLIFLSIPFFTTKPALAVIGTGMVVAAAYLLYKGRKQPPRA